jgi:undecaprenyl-diphosphatase
MPLYQVIVLAIVQSLTEFLPISSTAHLTLLPRLLGWNNPALNSLDFDIALHLGTLAAVVIYFVRDWVQIALQGFGLRFDHDPAISRNPRLLWLLALATLPVAVLGYLLKHYAEGAWRSSYVIAASLIVIGLVMWLAEHAARLKKGLAEVSLADSLSIGAAQALAIVPGVSRSGITISAGLFRGLDRTAAARFSFLLSTPALAGAAFSAFHDLHKQGGLSPDMRLAFLVGVLVSAVTGFLVIAWFLRFLRGHSLKFFVYYRIIFGIIILALAFSGRA